MREEGRLKQGVGIAAWAWETARLPVTVEYTSRRPALAGPGVLVWERPPEDKLDAGGGCWEVARDVAAVAPDRSGALPPRLGGLDMKCS